MPVDLPIKADRLEALCEKYGTPLQLYDEALLRANVKELLTEFGNSFDGFQQFFAVKALPNPAILKLLVDEGCGLDCSSVSELHIAKTLVPPEKVMYTSNYTSKKDLAYAYDMGVIINLDDISLVDSMVEIRGKCSDLISFRLNPGLGRTDSKTKSNVLGGPDAKFGVAPDQIVEAYKKAKEAGSTRFGIHMMTGSCVLKDDYWLETVDVLLKTMAELKEKLDIEFEFVNIGGGLGIPYTPDQKTIDLPALVKKLKNKFEQDMPKSLTKVPNLMMENGRYITGPFGWLVSRCEAVKSNVFGTYYGLDSCMVSILLIFLF